MIQPDVEVKQWEGREFPVWRFATYAELDTYMEIASPASGKDPWVARIFADWPEKMWGVIYRHEPMDLDNAIALMHINEEDPPSCQCGCDEEEHAFPEDE